MAPAYKRLGPNEATRVLEGIVQRCRESTSTPPLVVFDLDGTLMDNRPRTGAILEAFGRDPAVRITPEAAAKLTSVDINRLGYLVGESMRALGVDDEAAIEAAFVYWKDRFFHDDWVGRDTAVAGSVEFVRACYEVGASCIYLTGRDMPGMGVGTFKSLKDLGYPIGVHGTSLICKPDFDTPDETFKREELPRLRRLGHVVAAFDNEPMNCNIFREAYPDAETVFVDTQHAPSPPPLLDGVHVLEDFRLAR